MYKMRQENVGIKDEDKWLMVLVKRQDSISYAIEWGIITQLPLKGNIIIEVTSLPKK